MVVKFDFNLKEFSFRFAGSEKTVKIKLNTLMVFLITNLLVTITWMMPKEFRSTYIAELQKSQDNSIEDDFQETKINNDEQEKV